MGRRRSSSFGQLYRLGSKEGRPCKAVPCTIMHMSDASCFLDRVNESSYKCVCGISGDGPSISIKLNKRFCAPGLSFAIAAEVSQSVRMPLR